MQTTTAQQRILNVVIPFEPTFTGSVVGAIRIVTPRPYASEDYYVVSINKEEQTALFSKEGQGGVFVADHRIDLDMQCCDCKAYGYRRDCRHLAALRALSKRGII